jgi:hypothetical protein
MPDPTTSPSALDRFLTEAKSFFQSGLFFILLGGLIMFFGYRLSQDPFTHSAFVFLVVILGLALLLFGTGTSASGEGTSGQIKVAIAGGAGVLAMVLGFGVAHWREDLTDVFKRQRDYGIVELSIGDTGNSVPVDLDNFEARASWGEMPLPLWKDKRSVQILVPIPPEETEKEAHEKDSDKKGSDEKNKDKWESSILVELIPKPGFQGVTLSVDEPLEIRWRDEPVVHRLGFNNEFLQVVKKPIKQISKAESLPRAEAAVSKAESFLSTPE